MVVIMDRSGSVASLVPDKVSNPNEYRHTDNDRSVASQHHRKVPTTYDVYEYRSTLRVLLRSTLLITPAYKSSSYLHTKSGTSDCFGDVDPFLVIP